MWKRIDRTFLSIVALLVLVGFVAFSSASLGLLPRETISVPQLFVTQIFFGLFLGIVALIITTLTPYRFYKKVSLYLYIGSLALTAAVFIPGFGITANGATRWLDFGFVTIQPAEFLKLGVILFLATYLASHRQHLLDFKKGLLPFLLIVGLPTAILLLQPDTGTALVILAASTALYFTAGAPWRDVFALMGIGLAGLGMLAALRPYVLERLLTFVRPDSDPLGASYQIQQSLIAIGSGELFGRGLGQSVQKFSYLPEPVGDSIFAVFAEETGFIGSVLLIFILIALFARAANIAARAPDHFAALLVFGIISVIIFQSILNIGAMLDVFPLTGLPLIFVSHGGTALLVGLASVGIILNISAYTKKT